MRIAAVAAALAIVAAAAPARAVCSDGTEGPCDSTSFALGLALVGLGAGAEGSLALGGLVTMIDGAYRLHRHAATRATRTFNVVFGVLDLAAGVAWGIVAADNISPGITGGFAIPHLAVGIGDVVVAAIHF